jgi:uncharacterized cupredoxin-like copper-binding protein
MRRLVPAGTVLALAIVAAIPASPAAAGNTGNTVKISEKQWSISKPAALRHGVTYTIAVHNVGTFPHDLLIDGKGVSDRGIHNAHPIAPGKTETFTVKFPTAGKYHFYCAIKGHAAKGMSREVVVS